MLIRLIVALVLLSDFWTTLGCVWLCFGILLLYYRLALFALAIVARKYLAWRVRARVSYGHAPFLEEAIWEDLSDTFGMAFLE